MSTARTQETGPVYLIGYIEVMPSEKDAGAALVRQLREASRKKTGNLRAEVGRRIGQPNEFILLEIWNDQAACDSHAQAASTAQLRDKLKAIQNAPYDERPSAALSVGPAVPARLDGATIYAVTHIDVVPPRKDEGTALLKQHGDDSRQDPGNVRFEIVTQISRPNHFTAIEIWRDRKAADAHAMNAHTRAFRDKLAPMSGSLYDQRFYEAIDQSA
jgi:autoinducer 2-degrading protein